MMYAKEEQFFKAKTDNGFPNKLLQWFVTGEQATKMKNAN